MAWGSSTMTGAPAHSYTRRLSAPDMAVGLTVLADLLEAGLPAARTLRAFGEMAPISWQTGIPRMQAAVREGRGMATAMAEAELGISPLALGIIRAGEAGTGLAHAMRSAAQQATADASTRDAIRAALTYPAVVAVTGLGTTSIMVALVLPRFEAILLDLGQQLPPMTRAVLAIAEGSRIIFLPVVVFFVTALILIQRQLAGNEGRRRVHGLLLRLPVIGKVRRSAATARFTGSLSALLQAGVPLRSGLVHAATATGDAEVRARALRARDLIAAGGPVAKVLRDEQVVSPTAARLVAAGEETGRLASMLEYAARLEAANAERTVKAAVRLVEPLLILVFAAVVGTVAMALLQAVYAVRPQ